MPRKTTEEMIADLEAKLAKARGSAVERVQTQIEKAEAKVKALDERIAKLNTQKAEVQAEITALKVQGNGTTPAQTEDVSA